MIKMTIQPSPILYARQSICYLRLKDPITALKIIKQGYEKAPEHPQVLRAYGEILQSTNQDKEAILYWNTANDVDPYDIKTQKALTALYKKIGKEELAKKHQRYVRILSGEQSKNENTTLLWK